MSTPAQLLALASRILAREDVADAFGHVSMRHPDDPGQYLLTCSRSPELVVAPDIMSFTLDGAVVERGDTRTAVLERFIHGAAYEARPDVNCVVHAHCHDLLPFAITGAQLRPAIHMAGIIGGTVPIWDPAPSFGDTNLLVTDMERGRDLAASLGRHRAILMRGHGVTVVGTSVQETVLATIYLKTNAKTVLMAQPLGPIHYLSATETQLCAGNLLNPSALTRAWDYYARRANAADPHR